MKNAKQVCRWLIGMLGILGIALLTSCESSIDDIVGLPVANQTDVALSMYIDGSTTAEFTVPAHTTQPFVFSAGDTHQIRWQGSAIQGQVEVTLQQNEARTLTIWGSGNAYSLR